jgi:hypothetical protein
LDAFYNTFEVCGYEWMRIKTDEKIERGKGYE